MSRGSILSAFASSYETTGFFSEGDRLLQENIDDFCEIADGKFVDEENCTNVVTDLVTSLIAKEENLTGNEFIPKAQSDAIWLVIAGTLVFFMHAGFAMLEAGSVRRPNVINIMFKNIGTIVLGALGYWSFGFAFGYGDTEKPNGFIGTTRFFFDFDLDAQDSAFFFFQFTFAATAATIVSGAVAERINLEAYFVIAFLITSIVFPIVTHWVWSDSGFMSAFNEKGKLIEGSIGLIDFAGSGVVHTTGGVIAFVGAYIIGPRAGRFVEEGVKQFGVASFTLQTLGTFILWFGWYGFNPGSSLAFDGVNTAKAAVTTTLAPSAAGIVGILYTRIFWGYYDLPTLLNCVLAGLVSITAGCVAVFDATALIIGAIGGILYILGSKLLLKLKVDDPLGASIVHGLCGIWGVLAVGIFTDKSAISDAYGEDVKSQGAQFAMQLVGILIIIGWAALWGVVLFIVPKLLGVLRVESEIEEKGLDDSEHGGELVVHF